YDLARIRCTNWATLSMVSSRWRSPMSIYVLAQRLSNERTNSKRCRWRKTVGYHAAKRTAPGRRVVSQEACRIEHLALALAEHGETDRRQRSSNHLAVRAGSVCIPADHRLQPCAVTHIAKPGREAGRLR